MIFGLPEQLNEHINDRVSEVLMEVGQKPIVEASRIGGKSPNSKDDEKLCRPVKVTVANSTIVKRILTHARALRHSKNFKEVYISPDRSAEQRKHHRQLVLELKRKVKEESSKKHYIKGGQLHSVDK